VFGIAKTVVVLELDCKRKEIAEQVYKKYCKELPKELDKFNRGPLAKLAGITIDYTVNLKEAK